MCLQLGGRSSFNWFCLPSLLGAYYFNIRLSKFSLIDYLVTTSLYILSVVHPSSNLATSSHIIQILFLNFLLSTMFHPRIIFGWNIIMPCIIFFDFYPKRNRVKSWLLLFLIETCFPRLLLFFNYTYVFQFVCVLDLNFLKVIFESINISNLFC